MASLETLPNEVLIHITENLNTKDLQACRLVSSLMREKIDKLSASHLCITFNEKSEREFIAKKAPRLTPHFTRMRIEHVSYFSNWTRGVRNKKTYSLRKEYFQNITELEIADFVPKHYFHQIIELSENLRVLKLSSAVLGGTEKLFEKEIEGSSTVKPQRMLFLRRPLPERVIQNMFQRGQKHQVIQQSRNNQKWSMLDELHIKLDYVCPSTSPNFSPQWLVENLKAVENMPVPSLTVFTLAVEKSKENEMFYFTINFLLNTIPLMAYPSLQRVSVVAPKCRPISQRESLENCSKSKRILSTMQLSDFTVKICEGHNHAIPEYLIDILRAQRSLQNLAIEGIRNAHVLKN